ncbi:hypothetical protein HDU93_009544, partial [Gonapodya sp. JEL0774]
MIANGTGGDADPKPQRRKSNGKDRKRDKDRDRGRDASPAKGKSSREGRGRSPYVRKGGLHGYLKSAKFADALLKIKTTDNKMTTVPCHRLILSLRSDFFDNLFSQGPKDTPTSNGLPVFQLPVLPPHRSLHEVVGKILWALYALDGSSLAVLDTKWDEVVGVLRVAGEMGMTEFTSESERALSEAIEGSKTSPENLRTIAKEARAWGLPDLASRALSRLAEIFANIADLDGPALFTMSPQTLGEALELVEPSQQYDIVRKYLNTRANSTNPVSPDAASALWGNVSFESLSLSELESG